MCTSLSMRGISDLRLRWTVVLAALCAVLASGAAFSEDSWTIAGQDFPASMLWDATADVLVDADNNGTTTWDSNYALIQVEGAAGAASEIDTWGSTAIPVSGTVAPAASCPFEFGITAPPITTIAYTAPVTQTAAGVAAAFDCNWILASQYTPTAAMITSDTAESGITVGRFPDILPGSDGSWAAFWIEQLAGRVPPVVHGYPDGTYGPSVTVSRDQMAVFISRALVGGDEDVPDGPDIATFDDVPTDYWAYKYVEYCVAAGVVQGYDPVTYAPGVTVARDAMAVFISRAVAGGDDNVPDGPTEATFEDVPIDYWAYKHVEYCVANGVVQGYNPVTYAPTVDVSRDQMAVFVWRAFLMPTGVPVVLAGPSTCAYDPTTVSYNGWPTELIDPGYAYVAFDALRLDTNLCAPTGPTAGWDVAFDIFEYDLDAGTQTGSSLATLYVSLTEAQITAAKAAATASGDPYLVVSVAIPGGLSPGVYQLVVTVEAGTSGEAARKPLFGMGGVSPTGDLVYEWYWGDLHAHSAYSDGEWLPEEVYAFARDTARLDFFALTDHDSYPTILTQEEYDYIVARADEYDASGSFVALYGVEWTHTAGHLNFYMSPTPQIPYDLDGCYAAIADLGVLGHFNHPNEPDFGNFDDYRYVPEADTCMAMVEVRSGWWTDEEVSYIAMLDAGWHVAPVGCEDKHDPSWGMGPTWTVALASALTREDILDALWSRRVYSTADRNMQLSFKIAGQEMGSRLLRPAGRTVCTVRASDPDASDVIERIDLFVDGEIAASAQPGQTSCEWSAPVELPAGGEHYCFVRVTQQGERRSWSSPIWVTTY